MKSYFLSESCFIYNVSDRLNLSDNLKILQIYRDILFDKNFMIQNNIYDLVPTYNSLAFHVTISDLKLFEKIVLARIEGVDFTKELPSKPHYIDVVYDGIDLDNISKKLNLSASEIIKKHTSKEYHIAMLGFKPYFPYLLGLDESISLPRLDTPRNRIAKGSIGIGGSQTTVFPLETPSGWNIIGNTSFDDFTSFSAGDKIIFREV
ncbi:MAG: KipI family sensor histidine kinase inhibitor [Francisella sp.]|jgi:KipI family sensor histidine kinase inhibitor